MTLNVSADYGDLIKEAYLKPIRSVLIIDDDYPTLSEIIEAPTTVPEQARIADKKWHTNPASLQNLIRQFRTKDPALLIDIHDGHQPTPADGSAIAAHLHQSDLLVLDYNLEPASNSGTKSISIARELLSNDRFNIIVFHTVNELKPTFSNVLLGLMAPVELENTDEFGAGKELVQDTIDASAVNAIRKSIASDQYLRYRLGLFDNEKLKTLIKNDPVFNDFRTAIGALTLNNEQKVALCIWCMREFQRRNHALFSSEQVNDLKWSGPDSKRFWIRARSGFIAFAKKGADVSIFSELHETLKSWRPEPTRMISARLRAEIDNRGVIAEDITLNNASAFAGVFLNLLAKSNAAELQTELGSYLDLQTDQFLDAVKTPVIDFAQKLIESERPAKTKFKEKTKLFYGIDAEAMKSDILRNLNAFVCSKPVAGWHLATGHVLGMESAESQEYWVCLSPACDLVPGQRTDGIYSDVGEKMMPFMATQLHLSTSSPTENPNSYVYLPLEGGVKQFSFVPAGDNERNPIWKVFLAGDSGKIQKEKKIKVHKMHMGARAPKFSPIEATVVGQLRYEYALNLLNKFAANMSRVGLDFSGISL